jgi:CrcB protein
MKGVTWRRQYHPSNRSPGTLLAVAVGGSLGTLGRYGVDHAIATGAGHFPTATLIINLSGSLLIGLLLPLAMAEAERHPLVRPFLVTGGLGGWTTYSALAADGATLLQRGHVLSALGYLGLTVGGGLALVAIGFFASPAHRLVRYRRAGRA